MDCQRNRPLQIVMSLVQCLKQSSEVGKLQRKASALESSAVSHLLFFAVLLGFEDTEINVLVVRLSMLQDA